MYMVVHSPQLQFSFIRLIHPFPYLAVFYSLYSFSSLQACVNSPLSLISRPVPIPPPSRCLLLIGTPFVIFPYGSAGYLLKQLYSYLAVARRLLSCVKKVPSSHQPSSLLPQAA